MKTLKLKIFDVLVEKITVLEFENWLYSSEFLKEELRSNSLIFNLVGLNYKKDGIIKKFKEITSEVFCDKERLTIRIELECRNIIKANNSEEIENSVLKIIEDFDFDHDFHVLWDFHSLYNSFEGYYDKNHSGCNFEGTDEDTKTLAEQTLKRIGNCNNIEEKIDALSLEKEVEEVEVKQNVSFEKRKKFTLKNIILTFLKKI